jgi:citrate synthase
MSQGTNFEREFNLYLNIEKLAPKVFAEKKGLTAPLCANVDMYSGLVYSMLGIPEQLYTPLFAIARIAGWCAHRLEEVLTCSKIIRPAYRAAFREEKYVPRDERK